jgi:hypothetical protein
LNSNLTVWLKGAKADPWPEGLLARLGVILDPPQVARIAERSPWSAAGASAILESIKVKGRKLGNQAGALWNALLQTEKGARWLAEVATSPPAQEAWQKASGDGAALQVRHGPMQAEPDPEPYDDNESHEKEEAMAQQIEAPVLRPQEISPERKAELRWLIEAFRQANRTLMSSRVAEHPESLKAFSQAWDSVLRALEPLLPMQVTLPDEHRGTEIRRRAQIKVNVVNAVYHAIS